MKSSVSKSNRLAMLLLSLVLALPGMSFAAEVQDDPSAAAMGVDLLVARPLLLATTVVGTALYVVSLPFTLGGGNAKKAGEVLVAKPGEATFVRCLGCKQSGYDHGVQ